MEQQIALKESGILKNRTQDSVANKLLINQTLTSGGRSYKEERPPLHVELHPRSPLILGTEIIPSGKGRRLPSRPHKK